MTLMEFSRQPYPFQFQKDQFKHHKNKPRQPTITTNQQVKRTIKKRRRIKLKNTPTSDDCDNLLTTSRLGITTDN